MQVVDEHCDEPSYIDAIVDVTRKALVRFAAARSDVHLIFSAHGLPVSYIEKGDPYVEHVKRTMAASLALLRHPGPTHLAYQSRLGPQKWLQPSTDELLKDLGASGARAVCIVPVAFVTEHVETLNEIDIQYREIAREASIPEFRRACALRCHPAYIRCLADLAERVASSYPEQTVSARSWSSSFQPYDVVVAGAGISGLTCAWALRHSGLRVMVLEAGEDVGGCISTVRRDGCIADGGPQTFVATPALMDVVAGLGLDDKVQHAKIGAPFFFAHGRLEPAPTSPGAFIASPLLSPVAKLRLLAEPFIGARASSGDESVADFASRRGGKAIVDALVRPMINGIFAGDPSRLSVRSAFPGLVESERRYTSVMLGAIARRRKLGGRRPTPMNSPAETIHSPGPLRLPLRPTSVSA